MIRVFVSYRRDDSAGITGRIYDRLVGAFGEENVFKDVDSIPPGSDFRSVIDRAVGDCDVLLAIIGQQWIHSIDVDGNKRLFAPVDFVRFEIESGLRRNEDILVIPILAGGASMPAAVDLPESLHPLLYCNATPVRHDPDFHKDMNGLIGSIEQYAEALGLVREHLNPLTTYEKNVPWSQVNPFLNQATAAAGNYDPLIRKTQSYREHWKKAHTRQVERLLNEAETLLAADIHEPERILDLLDQSDYLAPDHQRIAARIERIERQNAKRQIDEANQRRATAERQRQQKIDRMFAEIAEQRQAVSPDFDRIRYLLQQIEEMSTSGEDEVLAIEPTRTERRKPDATTFQYKSAAQTRPGSGAPADGERRETRRSFKFILAAVGCILFILGCFIPFGEYNNTLNGGVVRYGWGTDYGLSLSLNIMFTIISAILIWRTRYRWLAVTGSLSFVLNVFGHRNLFPLLLGSALMFVVGAWTSFRWWRTRNSTQSQEIPLSFATLLPPATVHFLGRDLNRTDQWAVVGLFLTIIGCFMPIMRDGRYIKNLFTWGFSYDASRYRIVLLVFFILVVVSAVLFKFRKYRWVLITGGLSTAIIFFYSVDLATRYYSGYDHVPFGMVPLILGTGIYFFLGARFTFQRWRTRKHMQ